MENNKRNYETPRVTMHGTVQDLTLHGGGKYVDVPIGTVVTSINDITSGV